MIIRGGMVFSEEGKFESRDLCIREDRIVALEKEADDAVILDAAGCYVIPGLVDVHSHGAMGADFSDGTEEALRTILKYEAYEGVTTYCPTTLTIPSEEIIRAVKTAADFSTEEDCADIGGIHLEGPFVAVEKRGAQNPYNILLPDRELLHEAIEESKGLVKLVTLAPELPGAIGMIWEFPRIHFSIGHTLADYETAKAAFGAGADHVTHLYNAMNPLLHREPGVIGAAIEAENCFVELICDGIHVHPSILRTTWKLFGKDRIVMISDSLRATGLQDGEYEIGGQSFYLRNGVARLADGTIAGATTGMLEELRRTVGFGISIEEAVTAATANPARSIGIYEETGSLSVGKRADVLVLDENLMLKAVVLRGKRIR